jgi:hypothetical protein
MELKSVRQMARLVEQVQSYANYVDQLSGAFAALYSAILGREVQFDGPAERWIVWPQAGLNRDPREDALAKAGIRVVGYEQVGTDFAVRVGRCPNE